MGLKRVGDKVEKVYNVADVQLHDIFLKFGQPFLNDLGFLPEVHALGRKGVACYYVADFVEGVKLQDFLTGQNKSPANVIEVFSQLIYKWPLQIYNMSKQFINADDYVICVRSNTFLEDTIVTPEGRLVFTSIDKIEIQRADYAYKALAISPDIPVFTNYLNWCRMLDDQERRWKIYDDGHVDLVKKLEKLKAENYNLKYMLDIKNKKLNEDLMRTDTVKANLGEDLFNLYFPGVDSDGI